MTPTRFGDISWRAFDVPTGHYLYPVVATPYGLAALDGGDLRWSADGAAWEGTTLSISAFRLNPAGNDLIAYGRPGAVRLTWDGHRWVEAARLEIVGVGDQDIEQLVFGQVVFGPRGAVMSIGSTILFSTDGTRFQEAVRGPDASSLVDGRGACGSSWGSGTPTARIGPIIPTADGFVALTPANGASWTREPWCEPVAWYSRDGRSWQLESSASPFGAGAWVTDVAGLDGRFVAVGDTATTRGAAWMSDDGRT